jgi:cell division protein FtsB
VPRGRLLSHIRRRVQLLRLRRFVLWGSLAVGAWALVGGQYGIVRYWMLKRQETELVAATRQLAVQTVDLKHEIWRLQTDTLYIEKVARERLGFAGPNERVFKITPY